MRREKKKKKKKEFKKKKKKKKKMNNKELAENEPKDIKMIKRLLKEEGVDEYDDAIVSHLLEFYHRYSIDTIKQAQDLQQHDNKQRNIEGKDVKLAIHMQRDKMFVNPPLWEYTSSLSSSINSIPLPAIPNRYGILLPPEKYTLTSTNFQINQNESTNLRINQNEEV